MAFNLRLEMNNEKREALKASLNELIGIKNKTSRNNKSKKRNILKLTFLKNQVNLK